MRTKNLARLCIFLCLILVIGCQKENPICRMKKFGGPVTYRESGSGGFTPAAANATLYATGGVRTQAESFAQLAFLDTSEITVLANSDFDLQENIPQIFQGKGCAIYRIQKTKEGVKIKTPQAFLAILGTTFVVSVTSGVTQLSVDEGVVAVTSKDGGEQVRVGPGQAVTVGVEGKVSPIREMSPFERQTLLNPGAKVNLQRH